MLVSFFALYISWSQHIIDYNKSVIIAPGTLPISPILEGENTFKLEVINTSKANLKYYLKAETNIGVFERGSSKPKLIPYMYESQVVSLSKSTAGGKNSHLHEISLDAMYDENKKVNSLTSPEYYFNISIVDADNEKILFNSDCVYAFKQDSKEFSLYQTSFDTTEESKIREESCQS